MANTGTYPGNAYRRPHVPTGSGLTDYERAWLGLSQWERNLLSAGFRQGLPLSGQYQGWRPGVYPGGLPAFKRPGRRPTKVPRHLRPPRTHPALDVARALAEIGWDWYTAPTTDRQAPPGGSVCWSCSGPKPNWTWWPSNTCLPSFLCGFFTGWDNDHVRANQNMMILWHETNPGNQSGFARDCILYPQGVTVRDPTWAREGPLPWPAPNRDPFRDPQGRTERGVRQAPWWFVGLDTRTKAEKDPKPPVKPPIEPPKPEPPGPGKKERKLYISGGLPIIRAVSAATEALDALDCLWGALPARYRTKPSEASGRPVGNNKRGRQMKTITPQDKARDIYKNFGKIDMADFIACLVQNGFEDAAIGRVSQYVNKALGNPRGIFWGPAL